MGTYLVTWNPKKWQDSDGEIDAAVRKTRGGREVPGQWSTGSRTRGMAQGERVFLLRQGPEPRGIIGSGWITSEQIFHGAHWDESRSGEANYATMNWDRVIDPSDPLLTSILEYQIPDVCWTPQGGGVLIPALAAERLEQLWAAHTGSPLAPKRKSPKTGRQNDPVRRAMVENHAQRLLEQHFELDGWTVTDTRYGNPFDAMARKGAHTLYLEAKGTETDGRSVEVTEGEVVHARKHPGQCMLGIVSGIRFLHDGSIDTGSGHLEVLDWDPDAGALTPTRYRWAPGG